MDWKWLAVWQAVCTRCQQGQTWHHYANAYSQQIAAVKNCSHVVLDQCNVPDVKTLYYCPTKNKNTHIYYPSSQYNYVINNIMSLPLLLNSIFVQPAYFSEVTLG